MPQEIHYLRLQRAQEVDNVLLFLGREPVETFDDLIRLTSLAPVRFDCLHEIRRTTVVKEKDPLSHAPERGGSKLIRSRTPLCDPIRQPSPQVVDKEVGVQTDRLPAERCAGDCG